jgi:hypothetical protein
MKQNCNKKEKKQIYIFLKGENLEKKEKKNTLTIRNFF